jgi:hypothetical protein
MNTPKRQLRSYIDIIDKLVGEIEIDKYNEKCRP